MNGNFIPARDSEFSTWAQNLASVVAAAPNKYGVSTETVTALTNGVNAWEQAFQESTQQRDAAKAATNAKDLERAELEEFIRMVARQIQADPEVTGPSKLQAGLPVHSSSRTPVAIPSTAPVAIIETPQVQQHRIRLIDDENPHRRSRPPGVMLCEIIGFVGPNHPTENDFRPFGQTTRMTTVITFPMAEIGQMAWYRFRWVNTRGQAGPWSPIFNSVITG